MTALASKRDHLEALFRRYTDLASEVILKEDLLCAGVVFTPEAAAILQHPWQTLLFQGGSYKLFRTVVRPPLVVDSPYLVDQRPGEGAVLLDRATNSTIANVRSYPLTPGYVNKPFGTQGLRYGDIARPDGEVVPVEACTRGADCPVCAQQGVLQAQAADGTFFPIHARNPQAVANAAFEGYTMEDWPLLEEPLRISIDAGARPLTYEGVPEEGFFLPYLEAINQRFRGTKHKVLRMLPKPDEVEQRFRNAGVDTRAVPLGTWDADLFPKLHPEAAAYLSRNDWLMYLADVAYIYGGSAVYADFEIGPELLSGRFESQAAAVASNQEAFRFLSGHGLLPRLFHRGRSGDRQVPVEYFLEVDRVWYEEWVQAQNSEPRGYVMGIGRNRFPHSAAWDVGRGGPPEYATKWDAAAVGEPGFREPYR